MHQTEYRYVVNCDHPIRRIEVFCMSSTTISFVLRLAITLLAAYISVGQALATELEWRFGDPQDVTAASSFTHSMVGDGVFRGSVRWDPFLYFNLPAGGFDAKALHYLEVRLYSSAPADLLDVYYKATNGDWGLMGKFPIKRGWATYRMDMNTFRAHESSGSLSSKSWGGAEQRIITFRLDPGNEADRWILLSRVRLTDEPLPEGIIEEPLGKMDARASKHRVKCRQATR